VDGHPSRLRRSGRRSGPDPAHRESSLTVEPTSLAAVLADRYRVERELGAGGMATVYLAQDLKHDRTRAIGNPSARCRVISLP
jgi:serine/threonine protein kinase